MDPKRVISDPVGLISDLVVEGDPGLDPGRARTVVGASPLSEDIMNTGS